MDITDSSARTTLRKVEFFIMQLIRWMGWWLEMVNKSSLLILWLCSKPDPENLYGKDYNLVEYSLINIII